MAKKPEITEYTMKLASKGIVEGEHKDYETCSNISRSIE
jgi:hypothetical protein